MGATSSTSSSSRALLRFLLPVAAAIVLGCVALDPLITHGLAWSTPTFGASKVHRLFEELHPREVAILGSSRADGSYVPELIHPEAYNYGIEKTGHAVTRLMLERELSKPKDAPVIVNFDHGFFEAYAPNLAHFVPEFRHPEVRRAFAARRRWFHRLPTVRYFGIMDEYLKARLGDRPSQHVRSRGGFFLNDPFSPERFARYVRRREAYPHAWNPHPAEEQAWLELLATTPRRIVVVVAPYHRAWTASDADPAAVKAYLARMDALPNVDVVDLGEMPLPDSCFQNTTHVNHTGAVLFSTALRERLEALGIADGHAH